MHVKISPQTNATLAGISNDSGPIDVSHSFHLFNSPPVMGSCLTIPCDSWFHNRAANISIQINWDAQSLPSNFRDYYSGYQVLPLYENKSFLVNFILLKNNSQYLLNKKPLILFKEKDGKLLPESIFQLNIKKGSKKQGQIKTARFLKKQRSSYIRMLLVDPEHAFGHTIYAYAVNSAVMEMMKDMSRKMPSPPYTPLAKSLEVSVSVR